MTHLDTYLQPISANQPCGPSLEYDPEYAVLQARLQPKAEVQYGQFATKPEGPDWTDVERDCRRLLLKSKDVSLLIWLTRARTRVAGAAGLAEGLGAILAVLQAYPDQVHPQLLVEGYFDPAVRANALAALCDPEGLLGDVRDIVVSASTAFRLTMRDMERAHAIPRAPYSLEPDVVQRQLAALHAKGDATLQQLFASAQSLQQLDHWMRRDPLSQLGDEAPDLDALHKLFAVLGAFRADAPSANNAPRHNPTWQAAVVQRHGDAPLVQASALHLHHPQGSFPHGQHADSHVPLNSAQQREQVRTMLIQVRQWIEHHEPSSPVAVLLKQAQRMWGKRFSEIASQIPPELLQAWDQDDLEIRS